MINLLLDAAYASNVVVRTLKVHPAPCGALFNAVQYVFSSLISLKLRYGKCVAKVMVPFIAMYRKEQCLSLLDDFEQNEAENEDNDDVGQARQLKWHKVLWIIKELDMWLLFQKRKSVLQMQQKKIYDEECLKIDNSEKYTLNKQLFESISKSLNEAETKEEIDDMDAKYTLNKLLSRFNIICTIYNLCFLDSFDCRC
ncbi:hypothetical protein PVK06_016706 [Gossypium arboreum]|uniref:Uncharacterized protein n=1 Tax=Gossypium arboreum TaxID=29729 RepID=A0ABR0Q1T7_GOSAR|nr:hypothetical protein PVK06_016706 [Gossypium arboreum]